MPESDEKLQDLHNKCVRSLRNYMAEANKTCQLLNAITKFPVSMEERMEILAQRRTENEAHERYHHARAILFRAAQWE